MNNLQKLLTSSSIIKTIHPSLDFLMSKLENKKSVKIFYGETYDEHGVTIDSLKYYLVLSLLHTYLEKAGYEVKSQVIIADIASTINKSAQEKLTLLQQQVKCRVDALKEIIQVFKLPIQPVLMSEVFQTDEYKEKYKLVYDFMADSQRAELVFPYLEKTVLKNRISQEKQNNFRYSLEAVATSLLFDLKLGPPRELFYDQAAKIIAEHTESKVLSSVYLTPTFPLGKDFIYFLTHPEIEEFGLTPYKAGSNKLQDYRIILGKTTIKQVEELVSSSFDSSSSLTAHPVFDTYIIAQLAKMFLKQEFEMENLDHASLKDLDKLKKETVISLDQFVFQPLQNGVLCQP